MDDLASLFAQLEAAQEKKSSVRLSDRVVVELVAKLRDLGLFGDDLLHTINGREYITKAQVKKEIQRALEDAGGRIAVVDLSALLGVDLVHCQAQADELVQESAGAVIAVQGDLITTAYFDAMAAEVNEMLRDSGAIEMGDVAKQFELAADQVASHVKKHLGSTIQGTLDANVLYTEAFVTRVKSCLRGALRACVAPVSVGALQKALKLPLPAPSAGKLVARIVEELLASGSVQGVYKGGSTMTFTPAVYARAQADAVAAFYSQNGYVEYDTLTKMGVTGPKAFLRAAFPDGIALESAFVAPSITAQVDAAAEEHVVSGGWFDAVGLLPSMLSAADVNKLLAAAPAVPKALAAGSLILASTCLVSRSSLESWQAAADELARAAAKDAIAARASKAAPPPSTSTPAPAENKAAARGDDDDWDQGSSKKGKKGKAGKGRAPAAAAPAAKSQGDSADPHCPTLQSLKAWMERSVPDMEGCGADGELAAAVAQELLRGAVEQYQEALRAAFSVDVQDSRRLLEAAQSAAVDAGFKFALYVRGLDALAPAAEASSAEDGESDAAKAREVLERHLLRSAGAAATDAVLHLFRLSSADPGDEPAPASAPGAAAAALSVADRKAIVAKLPSDLAPCAQAILKAAEGASASASGLQAALEEGLEAAGVRAKKVDKKVEKAAVAVERQNMLLKMQAPNITPADALAIAVPCLVAKLRSKLVTLPGRSISYVLDAIKGDLSPEAHELVSSFHRTVLQQLTAMSKPTDPESADTVAQCTETLQAQQHQLAKLC